MTKKINLKKLDKTNWQKFRFDEIAKSITERVDPKNTELKIYIGLEHLDPESIHIKRNGTRDDVKGQKLKCYPGDVIFGKRRAYQRKAAIVTKEGFCSAHSMVLRANPEVIDPKLFPFFLHSDQFMNRAIDISVGSLSPTINWGTLKKQEFLLPPKEQQAKLAELFWAMDEVVEKQLFVLDKLQINLKTNVEEKIHGQNLIGQTIQEIIEELSSKMEVKALGTLGIFLKGRGISKSEVVESGVPCIRYGELYTKHHRIIRQYYSFISEENTIKGLKLEKNDILFAGSGETITEIGKSAAFTSDDLVYAGSDTIIFRSHDMDGIYLGYLMNSQFVRQQLNKYGTGATVMHIYPTDLKKIKIPIRNKSIQIKLGKQLEAFAINIKKIEHTINTSKSLQKTLINEVF
jgi:restriction endonuclease S subunit